MIVLPIKKQWFDMILSGEKKEEYREFKQYYRSRFSKHFNMNDGLPVDDGTCDILFRNGYSSDSPSFVAECSLMVGTGKEEWGAEKDVVYYILRIKGIRNIKV